MAAKVFLLLVVSSFAFASAKVPLVTAKPVSKVKLKAGKDTDVNVYFTVDKGFFHVQANPASETYLIPTELKLEGKNGVGVGAPVYPSCKQKSKDSACKPSQDQKALSVRSMPMMGPLR